MTRRSSGSTLTLVALAGSLFAVAPAAAQERFTWPEPTNLQKLPADFTPERLRAVMTGFSRALGVDCSHCHVGEKGAPLTTYDFASDEKPTKKTARMMLDLLGVVNDKLDEVEPSGPQRVNMWCHTCHRGLPRPMSLGEVLSQTLESDGREAAVAKFRELREEYYGSGSYDFSENGIESLARQLIATERAEDAIELLKLNVEFYPDSARAYGNLGSVYSRQEGERERAIAFLQKALELDPGFDAAARKLAELRASEE